MTSAAAQGFIHDDRNPQPRLRSRVHTSEPPPSSRDSLRAILAQDTNHNIRNVASPLRVSSGHGVSVSGHGMSSSQPRQSSDIANVQAHAHAESADTSTGGHKIHEHSAELRLACPFFIRTGKSKNATCTGPGWPKVHRIKEHLYRVHMVHQCNRCGALFDKSDDLTEHLRAMDPCPRHAFDPESIERTMGINQQRERELRKRSPRSLSEPKKWTQMYKVLFGDTESVPSPFYEDATGSNNHGDDILKMDDLYREKFSAIIRELLLEKFENAVSPGELKLLDSLPDIVKRADEILCETLKDKQSDYRPVISGLSVPLPSESSPDEMGLAQSGRLGTEHVLAFPSVASTNAMSISTSARTMSSRQSSTAPEENLSVKSEDGLQSWLSMSYAKPVPPESLKRFYCPYCSELGRSVRIKTKHDWKRHIHNFHELMERWECVCGLSFHSQLDFKDHHRERHRGQKESFRRASTGQQQKRVYACGYTDCVKVYDSFKDWCKHVADEMKENRQNKWDYSWRIRNILRSLNMTEQWQFMAEESLRGTGFSPSDLTWDPSRTHDTVYRLETYGSDDNPHELLLGLIKQSTLFAPANIEATEFSTDTSATSPNPINSDYMHDVRDSLPELPRIISNNSRDHDLMPHSPEMLQDPFENSTDLMEWLDPGRYPLHQGHPPLVWDDKQPLASIVRNANF